MFTGLLLLFCLFVFVCLFVFLFVCLVFVTALCVDRDILAQPVDLQTLTEQYADFAIDFINEAVANDTKPFFLYQAFNHMHAPVTANPLFNGTSKSTDTYEHGPMYGDALRELDYHIGRVVDTIDSLGIRNNTIIFFTGDNGGPSAECELGGSNGIFNGTWLRTVAGGGATGKATTWEGRSFYYSCMLLSVFFYLIFSVFRRTS